MKLLLKIFVGILLAPFVLWILANIGLNIWFQGMRMWNYWTVPESLYVQEGDRFVVVEAFEIGGLTHYNAPFTGGFDAEVPAGTVLRAFGDSVPGASAFGSSTMMETLSWSPKKVPVSSCSCQAATYSPAVSGARRGKAKSVI